MYTWISSWQFYLFFKHNSFKNFFYLFEACLINYLKYILKRIFKDRNVLIVCVTQKLKKYWILQQI